MFIDTIGGRGGSPEARLEPVEKDCSKKRDKDSSKRKERKKKEKKERKKQQQRTPDQN